MCFQYYDNDHKSPSLVIGDPGEEFDENSRVSDGAHRKCSPSLRESAHPVAVITVAVDGSR